jgi:putative transposase
MPRTGRAAPGGKVYHVLNRGNGRCRLFHKDADYEAFQRLLLEVREAVPVRLLAWCLMPNHWHLVLRPAEDGQLSRFMLRLSTAHVRRHFSQYHTTGGGHLYQGRFKSFAVQDDGHFLTVCRYVEANPLRGGLVKRAGNWPWSSLWAHLHKDTKLRPDPWPVRRPNGWEGIVQAAPAEDELGRLRTSVRRGRPFGSEDWVLKTARQLGLGFTLRDRGRPRKLQK